MKIGELVGSLNKKSGTFKYPRLFVPKQQAIPFFSSRRKQIYILVGLNQRLWSKRHGAQFKELGRK